MGSASAAAADGARRIRRARWGLLSWVAMAIVLAVSLGLASGQHHPRTAAQRAHRLAKEIRCPECRELSAADSDAVAARAVRDEIDRRVRGGESDAEIRSFLVSRYGKDILLNPPASGIGLAVWALPVAAAFAAVAGLAVVLSRWRRAGQRAATAAVSPADRARVEEALRR